MTPGSKLPILEISTLAVVVIASILALVPDADKYLLKMVNGQTGAAVESAGKSNAAGKAPRPAELAELTGHQAMPVKVRAVAVPTRSVSPADEFDQFETGMHSELGNSDSDVKQTPIANAATESRAKAMDSNLGQDQLSIDPFVELGGPEFAGAQQQNLEADEAVVTEFEEIPATGVDENIDWELDLKQPTSTDEQGRTTEVAVESTRKQNPVVRDDEASKPMRQDQETGHSPEPSTPAELSNAQVGPARLLGVSPPSVFDRFEFERGQIVVNQTLADSADLTLRASPQAGQQSQNSMARIVVDSHRSRTQKNPTLGPEFDWNEYIFGEWPRSGTAEKVANAASRPTAGSVGNSLTFGQQRTLDARRRMNSVLVPSSEPQAVERISRQPMSAEGMQRDNAFRPIR